MVLGSDVAAAGGKVKGWDIVGAVAILEFDGASASTESEKLVT